MKESIIKIVTDFHVTDKVASRARARKLLRDNMALKLYTSGVMATASQALEVDVKEIDAEKLVEGQYLIALLIQSAAEELE